MPAQPLNRASPLVNQVLPDYGRGDWKLESEGAFEYLSEDVSVQCYYLDGFQDPAPVGFAASTSRGFLPLRTLDDLIALGVTLRNSADAASFSDLAHQLVVVPGELIDRQEWTVSSGSEQTPYISFIKSQKANMWVLRRPIYFWENGEDLIRLIEERIGSTGLYSQSRSKILLRGEPASAFRPRD